MAAEVEPGLHDGVEADGTFENLGSSEDLQIVVKMFSLRFPSLDDLFYEFDRFVGSGWMSSRSTGLLLGQVDYVFSDQGRDAKMILLGLLSEEEGRGMTDLASGVAKGR